MDSNFQYASDGAPGTDGVTFEAIEAQGVEALLEQLHDELTGRTYKPLPARIGLCLLARRQAQA